MINKYALSSKTNVTSLKSMVKLKLKDCTLLYSPITEDFLTVSCYLPET